MAILCQSTMHLKGKIFGLTTNSKTSVIMLTMKITGMIHSTLAIVLHSQGLKTIAQKS